MKPFTFARNLFKFFHRKRHSSYPRPSWHRPAWRFPAWRCPSWCKRPWSMHRLLVFLLLVSLACLPGCQTSLLPVRTVSGTKAVLIISDQEEPDRVYLIQEVRPGDQIQISWTHSIEKSTWMDTLIVSEDAQLYLEETRFQSFGAGMPFTTEGQVMLKDGYVIMSQLHRPMPSYRWVHSPLVGHTVRLNGQVILHPEAIPHNRLAELSIRHIPSGGSRQVRKIQPVWINTVEPLSHPSR